MAWGYDAFVSYRDAADGRPAPPLQRGLERLARPWSKRRALRESASEVGARSILVVSHGEALEDHRDLRAELESI